VLRRMLRPTPIAGGPAFVVQGIDNPGNELLQPDAADDDREQDGG
jgi:hypothetical protein